MMPPGHMLRPHYLGHDVISCTEAACAKNIALENELKSLILESPIGFFVVNLRGDTYCSLRKVKSFLKISDVKLSSKSNLAELNLLRGAICVLLPPVWKMTQLLDRTVLDLDFVSTNNGTKSGYFIFRPDILLKAESVYISDFRK
jgi:hypothetical protein